MQWLVKAFDALTLNQLYACLQLRNEVFVVEQNCFYLDLDDYDQKALHLMGWQEDGLLAYCRLLPPGIKYEDWAIGRVVISPKARGGGNGRALTERAIKAIQQAGGKSIRISAQAYLEKFYTSFGFVTIGAPYDEAGIPHIEMLWG